MPQRSACAKARWLEGRSPSAKQGSWSAESEGAPSEVREGWRLMRGAVVALGSQQWFLARIHYDQFWCLLGAH